MREEEISSIRVVDQIIIITEEFVIKMKIVSLKSLII